jgi:hypothetical protein
MPEFLKGNYTVKATIEDKADAADSTDEFERKALSRLGGSICFVSKKSLMWRGDGPPAARGATSESGNADKAKADGARAKDRAGA